MGEYPVFAFVLGRMGFVDAALLRQYRAHALIIIMVISAIITPPDLFTLVLVTIPIYGLYEVCILVLKKWAKQQPDDEPLESDAAENPFEPI